MVTSGETQIFFLGGKRPIDSTITTRFRTKAALGALHGIMTTVPVAANRSGHKNQFMRETDVRMALIETHLPATVASKNRP